MMVRARRVTGWCLGFLAAAVFTGLPTRSMAAEYKVNIGFIPYGFFAPWYVAADRGFFQREGVQVEVVRGFGGADTLKKVLAGAADLGGIDPGSQIHALKEGGRSKMVMSWADLAPYGIYTLKGSPVRTLKDLQGKTIGSNRGDATWSVLPAAAELNGFSFESLKLVNVTPDVRSQGLLSGGYVASTGFVTEFPVLTSLAKKQGKDVRFFLLAKHGVDVYGLGYVTSDKVLADKPELTKKVLAGALKAVAFSIENPKGAIDSLLKFLPTGNRELNLAVWDVTMDLLVTDEQRRNGLGHMSETKWKATRDILAKYLKAAGPVETSDLYTNAYLTKVMPPKRGPRTFPRAF